MRQKSAPVLAAIVLLAAVAASGADFGEFRNAMRQGDTGAIKAMVKADPSIVKSTDEQGWTPLHLASLLGNLEVMDLLLAGGADLGAREKEGRTPLFMTVPFGQLPALEFLISKGADLTARDGKGRSVLQYAISWQRGEMVDLLVEKKTPLPAAGKDADDLLLAAASGGHERLVALLVARGASLAPRPGGCKSLLACASEGGLTGLAKTAVQKGAKVGERDCHGLTPLHLAAASGRVEVMGFLVSNGTDVSARSPDGRTAMNLAEAAGQQKAVEFLVAKGATKGPAAFPELAGEYLGQKPPGAAPEMFAPGIVSIEVPENTGVFSPDGRTYVFSRSPGGDARFQLLAMTLEAGRWTAPAPASPALPAWAGEGSFSPDGRSFFYVSRQPAGEPDQGRKDLDIWVMERTASGWGSPRNLGAVVNSAENEFFPTVSADGTLYFQRGGLWRALVKDGAYLPPEKVSLGANSLTGLGHPLISPDGTRLLFDARPPGSGDSHLYAAFRQKDGGWSEPAAVSATAREGSFEICPFVTADGRYLFFQRDGDVYWVDAAVVEKLRPKEAEPKVAPGPGQPSAGH